MAYITNRKARFDFTVSETIEAGIVLYGFEVKALRAGQGSIVGARVIVRGGEAFLVGATIPPYQPNNTPADYDPARPRKLLLSKKELQRIAAAEDEKGLTVVPISVYNKGGNLKLEVAIARGKKKHDKREDIKRRDLEREEGRKFKRR